MGGPVGVCSSGSNEATHQVCHLVNNNHDVPQIGLHGGKLPVSCIYKLEYKPESEKLEEVELLFRQMDIADDAQSRYPTSSHRTAIQLLFEYCET